jgi:hypothetical protein
MDTKSHPKSIKLPGTVEVFGNLKNAKRFAIDIGKTSNSCININEIGTFTFFAVNPDRVIEVLDCNPY